MLRLKGQGEMPVKKPLYSGGNVMAIRDELRSGHTAIQIVIFSFS
jgi:hypothetical protein